MSEVPATEDAIVVHGVSKSFKKTARKSEYSTLKSELVRLLKRERRVVEPETTDVITALKHIDLTIPKGSTVGIVGRNGSGKSTLLKLLTGIYAPTTGTIEVHGRVSALLELGAGFHPDFTGRENILINGIILGMSRNEVKARTPAIIEFAELGDFIDEPVRTYSSGMYMRLAFAVATFVEPEILIIDEILSVGDEHFSRKSMAKMNEFRRDGRTIVLVTHSLGTVETWCDQAVWIDGGVVRLHGPAAEVVREYKRAVAAAEAEALKTGRSALDQPGLALPQTAQEKEKAAATVKTVTLLDGEGRTPQKFTAQSALTVQVAYTAEKRAAMTVTVDVMSADGRLVFSAAGDAGEREGATVARLKLPRLSLGGGVYEVLVSVSGAGEKTKNTTRSPLHVEPSPGAGVLRPQLTWEFDA